MSLRWQDVDLAGKTLTVLDTKDHQDHTLPLSDYLLELLRARQKEPVGEYVFEGPRGRLSNLRYTMAKVAEQSGVIFTIHDLRRTFATVADSLDIPGYAVKMLLKAEEAIALDERGAATNLTPLYGRSLPGERVYGPSPRRRGSASARSALFTAQRLKDRDVL